MPRRAQTWIKWTAPALLLALAAACGQQTATEPEAAATTQTAPAADFLLRNGRFYTVDEGQPWASAVAIQGNTITYVGDEDGAQATPL